MNKQELHDALAEANNITISENVFIDIYGNDNKRKVKKDVEEGRADILARVHGLTVSKQGTDYVFVRAL